MKSRCRSVQRHLSDYINYTLSNRQTVAVSQHLRFCKACQLELESLRCTRALLHFYVYPSPPESYEDQCWKHLQQTIEKSPRPVWWQTTVFSQLFVWIFQKFLNRPILAWLLFVVLGGLVGYQFLQFQEQNRFDSTHLQYALSATPVQPTSGGGNRELISNRERLAGISQPVPEGVGQETQKLNTQLDTVEPSAGPLPRTGYLPILVSDGEDLKGMAISDASSSLMRGDKLSSPDSIAVIKGFSQPLERCCDNSFSSEISWDGNRSLNGFVDMLMNVPLPSLSITEVYDSVKL